ncbi:6-phosphogluconate dehydrogenase, NADP(+)-dependent, decarboxylating [Aquimixticola soesokkakensis]|uniref:6-phosphogluconate dehydrogenase, decarboxylating n=1 Tax=Aquimixticola soesokkakensis TaxID=1519096 RepID=A0A1Y5TST0_9RHOB|nr:NADP-dependent phosphogluconate dehydrogenase [Aquimixticola soesokkakensis]SLN67192.1 6-phosphogluconate dehydrogenase, NADP(+)-dependent, decarboxylating [Aquimixticola soesokkakensis]
MSKARIGLVGLGVMGANLALNIAENGFPIAVYNRTTSHTDDFMADAGALADQLTPCHEVETLCASLTTPRAIIIMVQAGAPVDSVIDSLKPYLEKGDMIIDAGNANFHDTRRREAALKEEGLNFIGMGVSGGEEGARHGPAIMVGGDPASFEVIRDIIEAISAKYQDSPCADHLGTDGAGHFVKTVHNGIEYADMQMIAEVYGILRDMDGRSAGDIGKLFEEWNAGPLASYLVEISAHVLQASDPISGGPMVDMIVDKAGQKGTGRWTAIEALTLGESPMTIEAAVGARGWSAAKEAREAGEKIYAGLEVQGGAHAILDADLEQALLAAKIIAYSQGFALLDAASKEYDWNLDLGRCAEVWRAGCIIRSSMLDEMASAARAGLPNGQLIFADGFAEKMKDASGALRRVVAAAALKGQPMPAFSAALAFFDTMRKGRGTTDLVQAQRDFFGAHGFDRVDGKDHHHGPWGSGLKSF